MSVKLEFKWLLTILVLVLVVFSFIFRDDWLTVLIFVVSWFWLYCLPGFFVLLRFRDRFSFLERFILATPVSAALVGIPSYYLGLVGFHTKWHGFLLPVLVCLIGWLVYRNEGK